MLIQKNASIEKTDSKIMETLSMVYDFDFYIQMYKEDVKDRLCYLTSSFSNAIFPKYFDLQPPIRSQCTLCLPPENFMMFSGGRERVYWKRMG